MSPARFLCAKLLCLMDLCFKLTDELKIFCLFGYKYYDEMKDYDVTRCWL